MTRKSRLDQLLVQRGLADDVKQAAALILRGLIKVDGQRVDKAGTRVSVDARLEVEQTPRYVSRGGLKLEGALAGFGLNLAGKTCLDLGASTGGFTDCLLQHGAARVYAFDVGRGQLDWKLRQDPRVEVEEGVNVRFIDPSQVVETPELITIDLSFISLQAVLPQLRKFSGATVVALVKPQFEALRQEVEKGGVVRDPETRRRIVQRVIDFARNLDFEVKGQLPSPVPGAKGNREVFLLLKVK